MQTMRSIALATLLLASPSASASPPLASDVSLADDAYHYAYFANGRHDANYIEWWYFNFFDAAQDIQAIFTYFIADPEDLSGQGLAQMVALVDTPDGTASAIDVYPVEAFSASYEQADVEIGGNVIQAIDEETYRIVGATKDGRLSWDLRYVRRASPWFAGDRINVGRFPWEQMSWLIYMPGADVSGHLELDGRVYMINSPGYHDHNWGEWIPFLVLWNWAQYFEPGLAFEMGDFIGEDVGLLGIDVHGKRTVFTKDQYRLIHTRWAFDPQNRKLYPTVTILRAENETRRLSVRLRAIKTYPLRGNLPFPLPDVIVYEQLAYFEGQLLEKSSAGDLIPLASFSGTGFKEYTARRPDLTRKKD